MDKNEHLHPPNFRGTKSPSRSKIQPGVRSPGPQDPRTHQHTGRPQTLLWGFSQRPLSSPPNPSRNQTLPGVEMSQSAPIKISATCQLRSQPPNLREILMMTGVGDTLGGTMEAMPGPVSQSRIHKGRAGCQGPRARGPFFS